MKTNRYIHGTATMVMALSLFACTDSWDDHYDDPNSAGANAPTLLEHIQADPELSEFLRVVNHVGYGSVLSSPQTLTLWAPVITSEQADSIIKVYETQKNTLQKKDQDNAAVTQFLQNHIALSGHSTNTTSNDSVRMWNGKYMVMTNQNLNGIPYLNQNIVASNGIMYKLKTKELFLPGVREIFSLRDNLKHLSDFYLSLDTAYLDTKTSVQRDVVDGEIVYADSVLNQDNPLYDYLSYIQREDSSYLCLAPTDAVWEKEYAAYSPMFNYAPFFDQQTQTERQDSIERLNAAIAVMCGRFFNLHQQKNDYNDSIKNTKYISSPYYYELNVFPKPKEAFDYATGKGILNGLEKEDCSNGMIYYDNEGRINPRFTFQQARYLQVTNSRNYELARLAIGSGTSQTYEPQSGVEIRTVADQAEYDGQTYTFEKLKDKSYIEVKPLAYSSVTNNNNSLIYFYLQNTFANTYYNIYVVMVPAYANREGYSDNEVLPLRFQAYYGDRLLVPQQTSDAMPNASNFPTANKEERFKNGSSNYFNYEGKQVEAICLGKGITFKYSSYNKSTENIEPTVRLRIACSIQNSLFNRGQQTNIMRINRVVYIPFATKEEAEAFDFESSNIKEYIE